MGAWSGPFLIAALVLAGAGIAKAVDPTMTVGALRGVKLRVPAVGVRIGGVVEAVLAVAAVVTGSAILALGVAASYLAFTGFVVVALVRRIPIGSCGCFAKEDTPPSMVHIVVNLGAAVSAVGFAASEGNGLGSTIADQPAAGVPFLLLAVAGAYAVYSALTVVPQLARLRPVNGGRS